MRRTIKIMLSMIVAVILLAACQTATISDATLKEDLLNLSEVQNKVDTVNKLSILSKTQTDETINFKLNVEYGSITERLVTDITLVYENKSGKWVLNDHSFTIVKAIPKQEPSALAATIDVIRSVSEGLFWHGNVIWVDPKGYNLVSKSVDMENGTASLLIEEHYQDANWSEKVEYKVDAVYQFQKGWIYNLIGWTHTITMAWAGTYDIPFTGSGLSDSLFSAGQKIDGLIINGNCVITEGMHAAYMIIPLAVSFTFHGVSYNLNPQVEDRGKSLYIPINNNYVDNFFYLLYRSASQFDNSVTPSFSVSTEYGEGTMTKQP